MSDFFQWLKSHIKMVCFILFILIVGVPFAIHILFKIAPTNNFFVAEWTAGELLGYYGTILGVCGTIILSLLALWQNQIIKIENDKKEELLQKIEVEKHLPIFKFKNQSCNGNFENLNIEVSNVSDNVANEIEIDSLVVEDKAGKILCKSKNVKIVKDALCGGDTTLLQFSNDRLTGENLKLNFGFKCKDKFGVQHRYAVISIINSADNFSSATKYKVTEI